MKAAGLRDVFDAKYYADQYPDLKAAFGYDEEALFQHFVNNGLKEGRNMSPILNVQAYRESYEDLDKAFGDNWDAYVEHYFTFGVNERRQEGVLFDPLEYADSYGDIKAAFGNDINAIVKHYLDCGIEENRTEGTAGFYKDLAVKQETEERIAREEAEREAEANGKSLTNIVDEFLGHMVTARNLVQEGRDLGKAGLLTVKEVFELAEQYNPEVFSMKAIAGEYAENEEFWTVLMQEITSRYPGGSSFWSFTRGGKYVSEKSEIFEIFHDSFLSHFSG